MGSDDSVALTDQQVAGLAQRDPAAITAAYEALADPLFRYVRSRCHDDDLAADIVEATFVELLQSAPRLQGGEGGVRRWLFTAARHNLLDELRKRRRRGDVALSDDAGADSGDRTTGDVSPTGGKRGQPGHADAEPTPEEHVTAGERDAEVRRALATLPADQREVLELRFAGELSAGEIGDVMGRSPGAVRVLQHRALKALSQALGQRHPDEPDDQVDGRVGDAGAHGRAAQPRGPPPAEP